MPETSGRILHLAAVLGGGGHLELLARVDSPDVGGLVSVRDTAPGSGAWSPPPLLGEPDAGLSGRPEAAVGVNVDGRLDVAARAVGGALGFISQLPPDRHWSEAWRSLDQPPGVSGVGAPACGADAGGRLEMFDRGDDVVWHRRQPTPGAGPWSPWASLGALGDGAAIPDDSPPAVARDAAGALMVLVRSTSGHLWYTRRAAGATGWATWERLPGEFTRAGPRQLLREADGRLGVYLLAAFDGVPGELLWSTVQSEGTSEWGGWRGSELDIPPETFVGVEAAVVGRHADGRRVVVSGVERVEGSSVWVTDGVGADERATRLPDLPAGTVDVRSAQLVRDAGGRLVFVWASSGDTVVRGLRQDEPNGASWSPFTVPPLSGR
jgi:hypothetical protein